MGQLKKEKVYGFLQEDVITVSRKDDCVLFEVENWSATIEMLLSKKEAVNLVEILRRQIGVEENQ